VVLGEWPTLWQGTWRRQWAARLQCRSIFYVAVEAQAVRCDVVVAACASEEWRSTWSTADSRSDAGLVWAARSSGSGAHSKAVAFEIVESALSSPLPYGWRTSVHVSDFGHLSSRGRAGSLPSAPVDVSKQFHGLGFASISCSIPQSVATHEHVLKGGDGVEWNLRNRSSSTSASEARLIDICWKWLRRRRRLLVARSRETQIHITRFGQSHRGPPSRVVIDTRLWLIPASTLSARPDGTRVSQTTQRLRGARRSTGCSAISLHVDGWMTPSRFAHVQTQCYLKAPRCGSQNALSALSTRVRHWKRM